MSDEIKLWVVTELGERLTRLEEKHSASLYALELQAKEYERRLEVLNHAHSKHESLVATFTSVEKFTGHVASMEDWKEVVNQRMAELKGERSGKSDLWYVILQVITLGIAMIALYLAWQR